MQCSCRWLKKSIDLLILFSKIFAVLKLKESGNFPNFSNLIWLYTTCFGVSSYATNTVKPFWAFWELKFHCRGRNNFHQLCKPCSFITNQFIRNLTSSSLFYFDFLEFWSVHYWRKESRIYSHHPYTHRILMQKKTMKFCKLNLNYLRWSVK